MLACLAASVGAATASRSSAARGERTSGGSAAATLNGTSPSKLLDEWAECEHSHGDPNEPDPTIDAHGVIHIAFSPRAMPAGDPHDAAGTCGRYLVAAQSALRAAHPVRDPQGVGQAAYLRYVHCMRTSGVPDYPYPERTDPGQTDFIGSGVDPNSPSVIRVNDYCGEKLGLPVWWIKGYGPPGDITVGPPGPNVGPPPCVFAKKGCGANRVLPLSPRNV